ncbi:MGH1-like glycoside hydrolase domain-containing protein [Gilvibacter sediminis]|uniref:MGH1-like glycoside hydrolase domain-containing protein n=1 Tax=Gilvibacter sediminis TaxID=379071 RepID=UPI002350AC69|nr:trehalase family glycosidase [Gilvibacter sediminis]MDC7996978.1 trehalase family glycosidase [Gilvibacter sediminis]
MDRRDFSKNMALAASTVGLGLFSSCKEHPQGEQENVWVSEFEEGYSVSDELSKRMYDKALEITKSKVRGGDSEPFFKEPFIDAAFSPNIFLWDTCFMCCFAKYHMDELPVYQALDNFYDRQEEDGYICREYRQTGEPLWPKTHPVSINPPLLAWAEWELYRVSQNKQRLEDVYPILLKNFDFHVNTYQMEDGLFYGDTLGMGMDNIPRQPRDWEPTEGNGLTHHELGDKLAAMNESPEVKLNYFIKEYVNTKQGVWNKQARLVDFSAQMGMFALQLIDIADAIGQTDEVERLKAFHAKLKTDINTHCWSEEDQFYYDLGFGKQVVRRHIGMYWMLLGELVPEERMESFLGYLSDPEEFYRLTPLPALSAADPDYVGWGDYWLGGVWAPTVYMVLKGLERIRKDELAKDLATKVYRSVATVFEATGTFWENYAPDLVAYGMPAKKDFCGWTALIPIAVYHEFIKS